MSQRIRRNGSPTSNCLSISGSATGGGVGVTGGPGASGSNAGMNLFSRLLPMKATVPFQLRPQTQPPLQSKSLHSADSGGGSPTHTSNNNNGNGKFHSSSGEAPGMRTQTSLSRSPTRAVSVSSTAVSAIPLSSSSPSPSNVGPTGSMCLQTGTASPSLRASPTNTTASSTSSSGTFRAAQTQSPLLPASPIQQLTFPMVSPHSNTHSYHSGTASVNLCSLCVPHVSVAGGSPCYSPTQQHWQSDYSVVTASLQLLQPYSASPPSSSSLSNQRGRAVQSQRWSPEQDRQSPERVSPGSPDERARHSLAGLSSSSSSSSSSSTSCIRRTSSLDALTGPYLSGHWPRDAAHAPCGPFMRDKSTQTPSAWTDECSEEKKTDSHKRSTSWGSTDQLKEIAKLRQQLQRSKHSSRHHRDKDRKSPFNGKHAAIHQSQAPVPKSVLIPVPKTSVSRFRNSVEGLNQEIERIIIRDPAEREQLMAQDVPDGRRAPPPLCQHCSSSRSINTQTPSATAGTNAGGNQSNGSSRSHSVSPNFLAVANDDAEGEGEDGSPSEELLNEGREKDVCPSSPLPKYASSPKPNNSYMFKREPPEGCERVKVFEETQAKRGQEIPAFLSPDKNKVNFIPNSGSAFCLVSILKPLLPTAELNLKAPAVGGSLSPLPLDQDPRMSRGTSAFIQQPSSLPLSRRLEETES
ncbi:protein FAM117B [Hypomesus transpacificus]|uniref:protein FAM117B n=1 Tax=Hypomesus transpacificus TaxID=137520 RepID=UPI001F07853B|nr:protein FAM117B [Hypomesus transpacificus]